MVKANKSTTHELSDKSVIGKFNESLLPIKGFGCLSGIFAQFPWHFKNDEKTVIILQNLVKDTWDPIFCGVSLQQLKLRLNI